MEFMSTKDIFLYFEDKYIKVPCTKSDIFMSKELDLGEKQKLLNFIHSVIKLKNIDLDVNSTLDFNKDIEVEEKLLQELKDNLKNNADDYFNSNNNYSKRLAIIIKNVLADANPNNSSYTLENLIDNIYKYLSSLQVYDNSPFLIPIYGSSEFSQSICRMASISSTIFVVNQNITFEITKNTDSSIAKEYKIVVNDPGNINNMICTLYIDVNCLLICY